MMEKLIIWNKRPLKRLRSFAISKRPPKHSLGLLNKIRGLSNYSIGLLYDIEDHLYEVSGLLYDIRGLLKEVRDLLHEKRGLLHEVGGLVYDGGGLSKEMRGPRIK